MSWFATKRILMPVVILFSCDVFSHSQTIEQKELLAKAREYNFRNINGVIKTCKSAWSVLEREHQGVSYNRKINDALTDCWRRSYAIDDSSRSVKITRQDMMEIFQANLNEINSHITFSQKSAALRAMYSDAHDFVRNYKQMEFRATIEKAQKLILKNLKPYISVGSGGGGGVSGMGDRIVAQTSVFKSNMRFLLLVLLNKHRRIDNNDEQFIDAKVNMFVTEVGRQFPYISAIQFESWVFSLLQDLFFGECVVCMDTRSEIFMPCCKSKSICRSCYSRVSSCPLCRAAKPGDY